MTESPPLRLERYTLVQPLHGAERFLAFRVNPDQTRLPVFLRLIDCPTKADRTTITSLLDVRHPNLLPVEEIVSANTHTGLVSPYAHALTLREVCAALTSSGETLSRNLAITIAIEVTRAIEHLHSLQMAHGSLTANNVLLRSNGGVSLMEYGETRLQGQLSNPQEDIFAIGLVLWELFTGQDYWSGMSHDEIRRARHHFVARDPRTVQPDLPPDLIQIMIKCLELEGFTGYAEVKELMSDLETARSSRPPEEKATTLTAFLHGRFASLLDELHSRARAVNTLPEAPDREDHGSASLPMPSPTSLSFKPKEAWEKIDWSDEEAENEKQARKPSSRRDRIRVRSAGFDLGHLPMIFLLPLFIEVGILSWGLMENVPARQALAQGHVWNTVVYLNQESYYSIFPLPKVRARAEDAIVRIETTPAGAYIDIDGKPLRRKTPTQVYIEPKRLTLVSLSTGEGQRTRYVYIRRGMRWVRVNL
ncbi:MAG: protein kinase [Bdellovibrionales bacterium]